MDINIKVDPRIELLSIIFHLAGNKEYNESKLPAYSADVERQFGVFRDHPVVKHAKELHESCGVCFDAPMSLAIHLDGVSQPKLKVLINPWPKSLDNRWDTDKTQDFLNAVGGFVKETGFQEFFENHRPLYETSEARMKELIEKEGHIEWLDEYFGERPQAKFNIAIGLLNGNHNYGPRAIDGLNNEELFCILAPRKSDERGIPAFDRNIVPTAIHEFCHSYINPMVDRHDESFRDAGQTLFTSVQEQMEAIHYGKWSTVMCETLVRGSVLRYMSKHWPQAVPHAMELEKRRGFLWMDKTVECLGEYEANRNKYSSMERFVPRLTAFFDEQARVVKQRQTTTDFEI